MNKNYIVFEYWAPKPDKINELLDVLKPLVKSIRHDFDGVSCCYLLKEQIEEGTAAIVTATCFEGEEIFKKYTQCPSKMALDQACHSQSLLGTPPRTQILLEVAGFPFRASNPDSSQVSNLHTMMAKIAYAPGTRANGIEHWQRVAASVEDMEEEGTHGYWFLADMQDENMLYSLEVYKDKEYLWDVHVPSQAIQENIKAQKDIRTGLELRAFTTAV